MASQEMLAMRDCRNRAIGLANIPYHQADQSAVRGDRYHLTCRPRTSIVSVNMASEAGPVMTDRKLNESLVPCEPDLDHSLADSSETRSIPEENDIDLSFSSKVSSEWSVRSSFMAKNTVNPIRQIVDGLKLTPNPNKPMIALSIGDPTTYGNFSPPEEAVNAVIDAIKSKKYDGYAPSTGILSAREAVAQYSTHPGAPVTAKDVILTSGASHALELAISVLCGHSSNLLIPCPGFSIYKTIACSLGAECRSYRLQPECEWEIDLQHLASLIDEHTAAIVVTNPSNPCGSVYSKEHLEDILEVAEYFKVPVVADEIYDDLVFPGYTFYPLATLSTNVPILSCSGLTKKYVQFPLRERA